MSDLLESGVDAAVALVARHPVAPLTAARAAAPRLRAAAEAVLSEFGPARLPAAATTARDANNRALLAYEAGGTWDAYQDALATAHSAWSAVYAAEEPRRRAERCLGLLCRLGDSSWWGWGPGTQAEFAARELADGGWL